MKPENWTQLLTALLSCLGAIFSWMKSHKASETLKEVKQVAACFYPDCGKVFDITEQKIVGREKSDATSIPSIS